MKINACDFCLGCVGADLFATTPKPAPKVTPAPWTCGWKGFNRLNACAEHKDVFKGKPVNISAGEYLARINQRAFHGYSVIVNPTMRPSERAMTVASLMEPVFTKVERSAVSS